MMTIFKPERAVAGLVILLILLFPACTVHKTMTEVEPPEALPAAFSDGPPLPPTDRWWEGLGDTELDRLVEEALSDPEIDARGFLISCAIRAAISPTAAIRSWSL